MLAASRPRSSETLSVSTNSDDQCAAARCSLPTDFSVSMPPSISTW
jgi:hypothetical protein